MGAMSLKIYYDNSKVAIEGVNSDLPGIQYEIDESCLE